MAIIIPCPNCLGPLTPTVVGRYSKLSCKTVQMGDPSSRTLPCNFVSSPSVSHSNVKLQMCTSYICLTHILISSGKPHSSFPFYLLRNQTFFFYIHGSFPLNLRTWPCYFAFFHIWLRCIFRMVLSRIPCWRIRIILHFLQVSSPSVALFVVRLIPIRKYPRLQSPFPNCNISEIGIHLWGIFDSQTWLYTLQEFSMIARRLGFKAISFAEAPFQVLYYKSNAWGRFRRYQDSEP